MEIVDISRHDEKMMMRMMTMTNVMANVPGPAECAERIPSPGTVPHFQHQAKTAAAQNLLKVCIPSHPLPPAPPGERARGPRGEGWAEAVSEPLGGGVEGVPRVRGHTFLLHPQAANLIRRVQPIYDLLFFALPLFRACNVGEVQLSKVYRAGHAGQKRRQDSRGLIPDRSRNSYGNASGRVLTMETGKQARNGEKLFG